MPDFKVILDISSPRMVVGRFLATPGELQDWSKRQQRFPERRLNEFSMQRQREHCAVDAAMRLFSGPSSQACIVHDDAGKPLLANSAGSFISIAHHSDDVGCLVAVSISDRPIGCDLEVLRPQLHTVAPRFVDEAELQAARGDIQALCAIWATKEAMFKAFGPALDFRADLRVNWSDERTALLKGITGDVRGKDHAFAAWKATANEVHPEFWVVCGPVDGK